ncbi:HGGxSTG domain-containing protein [Qipengyuania sp. NPDC077410]|uniref:HGGxSTG domain-containing protein n=1 Tax=Qipengyuania sp. NPDC077410 TaxID=3364496 RepID=UPI0037CC1811
MLTSARCGAKTRAGAPCRSPAVSGKMRCRMHGGAKGSGAPKSNRNAIKHGFFTREAIDERRDLRKLLSACRETLDEFK